MFICNNELGGQKVVGTAERKVVIRYYRAIIDLSHCFQTCINQKQLAISAARKARPVALDASHGRMHRLIVIDEFPKH